ILAAARAHHRYVAIEVGELRVHLRHEALARDLQHRGDDPQIGDIAGADLAVDHHAAGRGKIHHRRNPGIDGWRLAAALSISRSAAFASPQTGRSGFTRVIDVPPAAAAPLRLPTPNRCCIAGRPGAWSPRRYLVGATWRSGYATVCKTVHPGSIPGV